MRRIYYLNENQDIKKLMVFESVEGVFLFGYDCLQDTSSIWDQWFENTMEAENYCLANYCISNEDWIIISEPHKNCQHDFIMPTKVKDRKTKNPKWGEFITLINGQWLDLPYQNACLSFEGMTGNERLFVSGLLDEFDNAKLYNKENALKILKALNFDRESVRQII